MRAEIVGVGTELLLGQITNTNARDISEQLAGIGIDVLYHTTVGDNPQRMRAVIESALARCDIVIVTGGLGPTQDDVTREVVAEVLDRPLIRDERLARWIEERFTSRGWAMPAENLKQADVPGGATVIEAEGSAPGLLAEMDGAVIFCLPGVPWEMHEMMRKSVVPELRRRAGAGVIHSHEVMVVGLGESHVHEKIADLVSSQTNPTIAFLASAGRVRVRISAKARDVDEARALIAPVKEQIESRLGDAVVPGEGTLPQRLADLLLARAATVAAAESLTGGLIGSALTEAAGASEYFLGSAVTYATAAKHELAGVPEDILSQHGPVSPEAAGALAEGAARLFGADLGISATGVAGPAPQDGKPPGTVFVAASWKGRTEVRKVSAYGGRDNIRQIAVTAALDLGRRLVQSVS